MPRPSVNRYISKVLFVLMVQFALQVVALDPSVQLSLFRIVRWDKVKNLGGMSVKTLLQDSDGYLWLGTTNGLFRYDGNEFQRFSGSSELETSSIQCLVADPRGGLLVGTRSGAFRLYRDQVTAFPQVKRAGGFEISDILVEQDRYWLAGSRGLLVIEGENSTLLTVEEGLPSNQIKVIEPGLDGNLYIGTEKGPAEIKREGGAMRVEVLPYAKDEYVMSLLQDRNGVLWLGTLSNGVFRVEDGNAVKLNGTVQAQVSNLLEDSTGSIWLASSKGLCRWRDGRLQRITKGDGLADTSVFTILEDREGSLWLGFVGYGVNQLVDQNLHALKYTNDQPLKSPYTLFPGQGESLWIGGEAGNYYKHHILEGTTSGPFMLPGQNDEESELDIYSLFEDSRKRLWIGSAVGLYYQDPGGSPVYEKRMENQKVVAAAETNDGSLWFGTLSSGLWLLRDNKYTPVQTTAGPIRSLLVDRNHDLWVGSNEKGLLRFSGDEVVQTISTNEGLPNTNISSLHQDAEGAIWIGLLEGGLACYRDGLIHVIDQSNGLFDNSIYKILEDETHFWLSCERGVFRVEKAGLRAFMKGDHNAIHCDVYGIADGLETSSLNGGNNFAGAKTSDGRLWFPQKGAVVEINPPTFKRNTIPPPVHITKVAAGGKAVDLNDNKVVLSPAPRFEFHFAALSFLDPERVRVKYMLEGFDKDWVDAGFSRSVSYNYIPPRSNRFRVIAANNDGVWNETGASFPFYLKPHFTQSYPFYFLLLLLVVLLAYAIYKIRLRQLLRDQQRLTRLVDEQTARLREMDRIKTNFFNNISHEFRTPLTLMVGPMQDMLTGAYGRTTEIMNERLKMMLGNANRLMRLINQLLDIAKVESRKEKLSVAEGDLSVTVGAIVKSFEPFAERKGLLLRFIDAPPPGPHFFDHDKLDKILHNLISNAMKFTEKNGVVEIMLKPGDTNGKRAQLEVRDTGRGIPESDLPVLFDRFHQVDGSSTRDQEGTGIGLALVKELVALHHGTIEVTSKVGEGTCFFFNFPILKKSYSHKELSSREADERPQTRSSERPEAMADLSTTSPSTASSESRQKRHEDAETILIVDDNHDIRAYVNDCLSERYNVIQAVDGMDGLEKARGHRPDLIITDIMMPRMDGHAMFSELKKDACCKYIPVVMLTAKVSEGMKVEGLESGALDYLSKPFNARELLARVTNLLRLRRQERQLVRAEKLAALGALVAGVAHEINTPVGVSITATTHLKDKTFELQHAYETDELTAGLMENFLTDGCNSTNMVLNNLEVAARLVRTFKQVAVDNICDQQRPFKLAAYVGEILESVAPQLHESRHEVNLTFTEDRMVDSYPGCFFQVVNQLIVNSLQHGFGQDEIGRISIEIKFEGDQVQLTFADSGKGIAKEHELRIFDPFFTTSRNKGSVGLGLHIVHNIVTQRLNGAIQCKGRPGKGAVFQINVPVVYVAEASSSAERPQGNAKLN